MGFNLHVHWSHAFRDKRNHQICISKHAGVISCDRCTQLLFQLHIIYNMLRLWTMWNNENIADMVGFFLCLPRHAMITKTEEICCHFIHKIIYLCKKASVFVVHFSKLTVLCKPYVTAAYSYRSDALVPQIQILKRALPWNVHLKTSVILCISVHFLA